MTIPGSSPDTSVASGWADTMSLDALAQIRSAGGLSGAQQSTATQRFWSTPARPATSTVREVLQINLATPRLLNQISFAVAIFPQDLYLEYLDPDSGVWAPCLDGTTGSPAPVTSTVRDAMPRVLPPSSQVGGHLHPQHSFSGHWRPLSFTLKPVTTKALRLVLSRSTAGVTPVSVFGTVTPYALAVRDIQLGYRVASLADVPRTSPQQDSTAREDFAQTTDVLGSTVKFSVRVNSASNVLRQTSSGQDALTTVWKCQPQPVPWAVASFYLDSRDGAGDGQLLDRIYLDPLYDGPSLNLYYSNDDPTGAFPAPSDPLPGPVAVIDNTSGLSGDVLHSGAAGKDVIAFVDVANAAVSFDPSHRWWVGARLTWKFAHGTQSTNNAIFDCGEFTLAQTPLGLRLSTRYGDSLNLALDPFDPATPMTFLAWCDGKALSLTVRVGAVDYAGATALTVPLAPGPPTLRLGGFLGDTPGPGNFDLAALVLKVDVLPGADDIAGFLADPDPYVLNSVWLGHSDARTDNALLRYAPTFATPDYPAGLIGGTPDRYADLTWAPISRDYALRAGYLYFPPTKARYWKLEFSNLSPQYYEVFQPVDSRVEVFPPSAFPTSANAAMSAATQQELFPGLTSSYVVNAMTQRLDFGHVPLVGTGSPAAGPTRTTARVVTDQAVRAQLSNAYWAWSFLPLHAVGAAPSFPATGRHVYEVVNYRNTNKMAYFVGLRSVSAFRLDYLSTNDVDQVVEMFHDLSNVDTDTNFVLEESHRVTSGAASYAEIRGKPINSNKVITGVQFASQQSEPLQLLAHDDFADPTLATWSPVGDAVLTSVASSNATLGHDARIDRSFPALTWLQVAQGYGTWGAFAATGATYDSVQRGTQIPQTSGGVASAPVSTPPGGRVYAAARVTASADLGSPLYVQIVDEDTGAVVSESVAPVHADKITEWWTGYTIGEGLGAAPFRWSDFARVYASLPLTDTFLRANALLLGAMDTGETWSYPLDNLGNPLSLAVQSDKAVVTLAGQSNSVDTGSPWGTLQFTTGTMGTGSTGEVMLARIGCLFLDSAGVLNNAAGAPFAGTRGNVLTTNQTARAVQAGDTIRIDIMPTALVPAGKADVAQVAGTDPTSVPYSLLFWLNGTWVRTFSTALGASPLMAIKGRIGQQFTAWSWSPAPYGRLLGPVITGGPHAGNGGWFDPTSQTTWIDTAGNNWQATGTWDTSVASETPANDNVGPCLVARSTGAAMVTDTGVRHGALSVRLRNIAGTFGLSGSAGWHGNVLCLDHDHDVWLDYLGRVTQGGVVQGTLFPTGLVTGAQISVHFIHVASMQPGNRPVDPAVIPTILVGKIDGVVQGTLAIAAIATWTGTKRGVAGDLYNIAGGSRPGGADYTLDTAFQAVNWAPDATYVALDGAHPSWDNVTEFGGVRYGDLDNGSLVPPRLRARVVQKGPSTDVWEIAKLSLFADPLVWSFSRDGGYTFTAALDVRNNPDGVMIFPTGVLAVDANQKPGTSLVWRCVSYQPGSAISSLVIRPWYAGRYSSVTHRAGLAQTSPNVMPYDHYGDIHSDSRFATWHLPVPRSWWYAYEIIARSQIAGPNTVAQPATDAILLSQSLISNPGGS